MTTSLTQSLLMAVIFSVNKYTSSNVHAVCRREATRPTSESTRRREVIISTAIAALPITISDSKTRLLEKYLKKSEENKTKNDKERMDSYYQRNYRDYFEFVEGSIKGKNEQELTESEKGILDWLKQH